MTDTTKSEVIYRGSLTKDKLKELARIHLGDKPEYAKEIENMERQGSTHTNTLYTIIQMADGNFMGETLKNGIQIRVRDVGPEVVLMRLITHE